MKKTYVTPDVEKVAFQYRDQVVAASGSIICGQEWTGYGSADVNGCRFTGVVQKDSGY